MSSSFKDYMESSGGARALWNVLIELDKLRLTTKLDDPVEFVRRNIDPELTHNFDSLQQQIKGAKRQIMAFSRRHPKIYDKYIKSKTKRAKKATKTKKKK